MTVDGAWRGAYALTEAQRRLLTLAWPKLAQGELVYALASCDASTTVGPTVTWPNRAVVLATGQRLVLHFTSRLGRTVRGKMWWVAFPSLASVKLAKARFSGKGNLTVKWGNQTWLMSSASYDDLARVVAVIEPHMVALNDGELVKRVGKR